VRPLVLPSSGQGGRASANQSLLVSVHEDDTVVISPPLRVGRPAPTRQSVEQTRAERSFDAPFPEDTV
jgi:hypothetical protein